MAFINPYSAEHPVPPSKFAGRKQQIYDFNRFMLETLGGNSKNLAILGEWGIGKTSLLRKFKELGNAKGFVSTIIELGEGIGALPVLFETITRSLADEAQKIKKISMKVKEFLESLVLNVSYGPLGISTHKKDTTPDILKFKKDIKDIKKHIGAPFIIMLDNAEQLLKIKGSLMELRNIFQSLQSMEEVNCMLILAGKEQLFSGIREAYEPAIRFFWSIEVPPFTPAETKEAIKKPLQDVSIRFTENLIESIHNLTLGHPYFVQLFAYNLFNLRGSEIISDNDLNENYSRMFDFMGKRLFESTLNMLSVTERNFVAKLSSIEEETFSNADAKKLVGIKGVNQYLKNLSESESPVLLKAGRGKYKFYHPLFKGYVKQIQ